MLKLESQSTKPRRGHTYVQWICGIIANSLLFCYGMQAGWMSPTAKVLQSHSSPSGSPLSDSALGWVASAVPICAMLFVPAFAYLADRIGRKKTILLLTLPQVAAWLLKMLPNTTSLVLARVCVGIAAAGCYIVVPMYNKEISQDHNRGALGSLLIMFYNLGILAMYTLGTYLSYYTVLYIVIPMPVLSFLFMLKCPESPGYLVKIGKLDQAAEALSIVRGLDIVDKQIEDEINAMKKQNEYYKSLPSLSMIAIVKDKAWRKAAILASILISVQAFSGNFALVSYGAKIIAASGSGLNEQLQTLSFPAVMMTGSIISMCVVERVGRKFDNVKVRATGMQVVSTSTVIKMILLVSYLVSAASLASLALLLQTQVSSAWMLVAIMLSMLSYAGGVQPVPYILMSELFNIQIRAKLMGVIVSEAWIVSFAQLAAFAPISTALGMHANFYFYAVCHLLGIAAVLVLLPETKGKSIEELETELRK